MESIKEKAQRYDEALERSRKIYNDTEFDYERGMMEEIFPELKESDDERIRKAIISFLKRRMQVDSSIPAAIGSWIAWLEKQDKQETLCDKCRKEHPSHFCQDITALGRCAVEHEQKSDIKIEPKFKVGDWIVYKDTVWKVCNISLLNYYELLKINNEVSTRRIEDVDNNARLWTIQDAKDGDVLVDGNLPFIFEKIDTNKYSYAYCGISVDDGFKIESEGKLGEWTWMQDIKPATKEQRALLFQKMKEAGYEWDANKKELRKIEQKPTLEDAAKAFLEALSETPYNNTPIVEAQIITKQLLIFLSEPKSYNPDAINEQKPAWSEEDEKILDDTIELIEKANHPNIMHSNGKPLDFTANINFLKSLKDRVRPKVEWSEEDEEHVNSLLKRLKGLCRNKFARTRFAINEDEDWLKSLRPQPKQDWSQNDIDMIDWLIRCCEKEHEELCNDKYGHQDIVSDLKRDCRKKWDWLESLKSRVAPQKQWKLSEEQMDALKQAKTDACGKPYFNALASLYVNLKGYR